MTDIASTTFSIAAEQSVLGGLMLDPNAIDRIGSLRAGHFYRQDHRTIFEAILSLTAIQKPIDIVTVHDRLASCGKDEVAGGLVYLHALTSNTPSAANIHQYAATVKDRALKRNLLLAVAEIRTLVESDRGLSAEETLNAALGALGQLEGEALQQEPASIQEAASRYINDLDERYHGSGVHPAIPTGLCDLDKMLNGGLRRGALITIGARPGMGKSALAETISCNVSTNDQGHAVLFLSQEMPESEVTERALSNWGSVPNRALSIGTAPALADQHWANITHAVGVASNARLHIDDQPSLTLLDVVAKARAMKRKHGLDLLVIDYLQLMAGAEDKRHAQLETITKGLKALAKSLDIAVLALSQFSRDIEKRPDPKPKKSDFKDAGSIEQDSDILMGLHRDEEDDPNTDWKGMAELFVMKHRRGAKGRIVLTYQGDYMRFVNFDGGHQPAEDRPRRSGGSGRKATFDA
jgi:replicative DNA helicase